MKAKHDAIYDEAIKRAEEDFRRPDGEEMDKKCPYIFSSNMADAYWITAHALYYSGQKPRTLHKSRGNKWTVDMPGVGITSLEVIKADHRRGVIGSLTN